MIWLSSFCSSFSSIRNQCSIVSNYKHRVDYCFGRVLVKNVKVLNAARGVRLEGLLLGVGLTLIILGAVGMVVPGPGFIPIELRTGVISWNSGHFESWLYVQMLPTQYAQARLQVQEGGNSSQIEVTVFSNYQVLSPVNIQIVLLQAINQSVVNFILSWANATHDQLLPFTGFHIHITGSGPTQIIMTYIIQYYGSFTYYTGLILIGLAALPFWTFIILAYLRRRRQRKAEQKTSMQSENDLLWE